MKRIAQLSVAVLALVVTSACSIGGVDNGKQKTCSLAYKTSGVLTVQVTDNQATASFDFTRRSYHFQSGTISLLDGAYSLASGPIENKDGKVKGSVVGYLTIGSHDLKAQAQVKTDNGGDDTCTTEVYTVKIG